MWQVGEHTQEPVESHVKPRGQTPQFPPQPSGPQLRRLQSGTQMQSPRAQS
jgi:hypothetical protein